MYSVFSFVFILMVEIPRVEAKKNPQRRGGNGFMDGSPGADDFLRQDLHFRPNALTSCVTDDVGVVCFSDKRKDNKIGIKAASISGLIFKQHKGKPLF